MAAHQGTALQGQTKDTLRFPRITWLFILLFGLIGIATYWAIGYGIYELAAALLSGCAAYSSRRTVSIACLDNV